MSPYIYIYIYIYITKQLLAYDYVSEIAIRIHVYYFGFLSSHLEVIFVIAFGT